MRAYLPALRSSRGQYFSTTQFHRIPLPLHNTRRSFLCTLAIETSCDDTSVAILEHNAVKRDTSSSNATLLYHKTITSKNTQYGGIHPIAALESHQESLSTLVRDSLRSLPDVGSNDSTRGARTISVLSDTGERVDKTIPDFISVTRGPGMRANLQTGLDIAKGLSVAWDIPLVGVHHMQAHALTPRLLATMQLQENTHHGLKSLSKTSPAFPFLSLLVSGGHTLLIKSKSLTEHSILAETVDTAIGDCLDKIARSALPPDWLAATKDTMYGALLEKFAFPNGAADHVYEPPASLGTTTTSRTSKWGWAVSAPFGKVNSRSIAFDKANRQSLSFSFTGLTTSAERIGTGIVDPRVKPDGGSLTSIDHEERRELAREAMRVSFEHLAHRVVLALRAISQQDPELALGLRTMVVSGGVAANKYLRHVLSIYLEAQGYNDMSFVFPPPEYCTDNAAMIAWAGMEMFQAGHTTSLAARSIRKWPIDQILNPPST